MYFPVINFIKTKYQPLLGFFLICIILYFTDLDILINNLVRSNMLLLLFALIALLVSQLITVFRWKIILQTLNYQIKYLDLLNITLQSNLLLNASPFGTLLGETWRLTMLKKIKKTNLSDAIFSVFFDKLLGLTSTAIISILIFTLLLLSAQFQLEIDLFHKAVLLKESFITNYTYLLVTLYFFSLIVIILLPLITRSILSFLVKIFNLNGELKLNFLIYQRTLAQKFPIKLTFISLLVQFLINLSILLCFLSVQVEMNFVALFILMGGISVICNLPISLGGFGAREAAILFFFIPLGYNQEDLLSGSILFGILLFLISFLGFFSWFYGIKK